MLKLIDSSGDCLYINVSKICYVLTDHKDEGNPIIVFDNGKSLEIKYVDLTRVLNAMEEQCQNVN